MTDRIDDLVQTIDYDTFKIMLALEDKIFYENDKVAKISLNGWCKLYDLTADEFIEWCEDYY